MPSATLNLRFAPRRMLDKKDASEYCGLPVAQTGIRPVEMPNGKRLWDMRDLDTYLDELKSGCVAGSADEILGRLVR